MQLPLLIALTLASIRRNDELMTWSKPWIGELIPLLEHRGGSSNTGVANNYGRPTFKAKEPHRASLDNSSADEDECLPPRGNPKHVKVHWMLAFIRPDSHGPRQDRNVRGDSVPSRDADHGDCSSTWIMFYKPYPGWMDELCLYSRVEIGSNPEIIIIKRQDISLDRKFSKLFDGICCHSVSVGQKKLQHFFGNFPLFWRY